ATSAMLRQSIRSWAEAAKKVDKTKVDSTPASMSEFLMALAVGTQFEHRGEIARLATQLSPPAARALVKLPDAALGNLTQPAHERQLFDSALAGTPRSPAKTDGLPSGIKLTAFARWPESAARTALDRSGFEIAVDLQGGPASTAVAYERCL